MRRNSRDPHDDTPKRRAREPAPPVPTLAELRSASPWFWVYCRQNDCTHYAANVSLLKESATRLLDEFGQSAAVAEHFVALNTSIQTKVFRELWLHPGISFLDLLDVVQPTLTLAEAHEAEQWLRKLRRL